MDYLKHSGSKWLMSTGNLIPEFPSTPSRPCTQRGSLCSELTPFTAFLPRSHLAICCFFYMWDCVFFFFPLQFYMKHLAMKQECLFFFFLMGRKYSSKNPCGYILPPWLPLTCFVNRSVAGSLSSCV